MQHPGVRAHFLNPRYCPFQRVLNLQIALNRPKGARRRQTRLMYTLLVVVFIVR